MGWELSLFWRSIGGSNRKGEGYYDKCICNFTRGIIALVKMGVREGVCVWTRHVGQRCATYWMWYNCRLLYPCHSIHLHTRCWSLLKETCVLFKGHLHKSKQAGWLLLPPASRERQLGGERSASKSNRTDSGLHDDIWFSPASTALTHAPTHIYTHTHTSSLFPFTVFFLLSRLLVSPPHPSLTVLAVSEICDL